MIFEERDQKVLYFLNQARFAFEVSLIKNNLSANELPITNKPFLKVYLISNTNVS